MPGTFTVQPVVLKPGAVAGTVKADGRAVSGGRVTLSPGGASTVTASNGTYRITGVRVGTYRATYAKTGYTSQTKSVAVTAAKTSTVNVSLLRPAYLTTPFAPTFMSRTRSYSVYGYLKPRHSGYPVRIYAYRYDATRRVWQLRVTAYARAYNFSSYTKYVAKVRLPSAGTWRIRAYHSDSVHSPTYGGYKNVRVR